MEGGGRGRRGRGGGRGGGPVPPRGSHWQLIPGGGGLVDRGVAGTNPRRHLGRPPSALNTGLAWSGRAHAQPDMCGLFF